MRSGPTDGTPFEREMLSAERPSKEVRLPHPYTGKPVAARLVVLSDEEIATSQADAARYLEVDLKLSAVQLALAQEGKLYEAEEQRQILARGVRDVQNVDAPFASIEQLRSYLTPETRLVWMRHLVAYNRERSPIREEHDPEKILGKVRDLKEAGALLAWLLSCDFDSLVSTASTLAEAYSKLTSPNSSDSSTSSSPSADSSAATRTT